jgi:hypothetical protein
VPAEGKPRGTTGGVQRMVAMKRIALLVMALFFSNLFSSPVFAGDPPSTKIKNLPAKFQEKLGILLDDGAGGRAEMTVTVIVLPDGNGTIETTDYFFGNVGVAGRKSQVVFEVEDEYLVAIKSSPPVNKLKKFRINGDELFLEGWKWKSWYESTYTYSPIVLKRISSEIASNDSPTAFSNAKLATNDNPYIGLWEGYSFVRLTLQKQIENSEREISIEVNESYLIFVNKKSWFAWKGPYKIDQEGNLVWEISLTGQPTETLTFKYTNKDGEKIEGRSSPNIKTFYVLRREG